MWVLIGSLHVLQFLLNKSTQQNSCCIGKSTMKPKSDLASFSYGYRKSLFVDFLIGYIGPPNCVHY
jgi:hypothetical protein